MSEQTATRLRTRIVHKHDIEANWLKAENFVPLKAELIVYDVEIDENGNVLALPNGRTTPYTYERFKIGDGITLVSELPFITNLPFEKGLSIDSVQMPGNIAGTLGYYYSYIDLENKKIYLTAERVIPEIGTEDRTDITFETPAYAVGDGLCLINNDKFDFGAKSSAKIATIENNVITYTGEIGFTEIKTMALDDCDIDDYTLFTVEHPEVGIVSVRTGTFAIGIDSKALGLYATASGKKAVAIGNFGSASGRETTAYYAAHAEGYKTKAIGNSSHSEGQSTTAVGQAAHAEGHSTIAEGLRSHAEGLGTKAHGENSHAEGASSETFAVNAHAEGDTTKARGKHSHTEGYNTETKEGAEGAHAEGYKTYANGVASHAEGYINTVDGNYAHVEGYNNTIESSATAAHAEGQDNTVSGALAHAEGEGGTASGISSHTEGTRSIASEQAAHAEGYETKATGAYSHSEGYKTETQKYASHAEGGETKALKGYSHAEGYKTIADSNYAHAEGGETSATGVGAHAEGLNSEATNDSAHAEGKTTHATGVAAHAEGRGTIASGNYSHASGYGSEASNIAATAIGNATKATQAYSFAFGNGSEASGEGATAGGKAAKASGAYSFAFGNEAKASATYASAFGNGTVASGLGSFAAGGKTTKKVRSRNIFNGALLEISDADALVKNKDGSFQVGTGQYPYYITTTTIGDMCPEMVVGKTYKADYEYTSNGYSPDVRLSDPNSSMSFSFAEVFAVPVTESVLNYYLDIYTGNGEDYYDYDGDGVDEAYPFPATTTFSIMIYEGDEDALPYEPYYIEEPVLTTAAGASSIALGQGARAAKEGSFSQGLGTIANKARQSVFGQYNIEDTEDKYAHILGWGWADNNRINIHTVDTAGNAWYKKDVYVGGTSQANANKLATEKYVTNQINGLKGSAPEVYNTLEKIAAELSKDNSKEIEILNYITTLEDRIAALEAKLDEYIKLDTETSSAPLAVAADGKTLTVLNENGEECLLLTGDGSIIE